MDIPTEAAALFAQRLPSKDIAERLSVEARQVRKWRKAWKAGGGVASPAPARAPAQPDAALDITALSRLDRLRWQLGKLQEQIAEVEGNPKATTALSGLSAQLVKVGNAYDEERARITNEAPRPEDALTDDELVEELLAAIDVLGPDAFEALAARVDQRREGLRVVGGTDAG